MRSRLGIPLIFGIDAIHGNALAPNNTNYPTNIGLACSFNTELAYKIARQTAKEMRAMNMHWTFNPNVDVARDARWGRCGETYGEDPYLVGELGLASVKGYQGNLDSQEDVLACIKHLVAGSQSIDGTNSAPTDVSERTLREVFLYPYERCLKGANVGSLMTAHNEISGTPCHSSKWLMEDVMRDELGFSGFVVSDWMDIGIGIFEKTELELCCQDTAYRLVDAALGNATLTHQLDNLVKPVQTVHMHIHTGHNREVVSLLATFGYVVQIVYTLDIHPVADNKTLEATLATHNILHQPLARGAGSAANLVVGGHQRADICAFKTTLIGIEEDLTQRALRNIGRSRVCSVY